MAPIVFNRQFSEKNGFRSFNLDEENITKIIN